ncbi:alpha/beta fold hydrolase [Streptomyces aureus]|uniref:alpha/beta fold hydrolase n=1 Tax=Streptomyces aureus TaxID=193461 RepID=UPI00099C5A25|nr:alpha/beta fold hydrolase [Streptomyces aureus]
MPSVASSVPVPVAVPGGGAPTEVAEHRLVWQGYAYTARIATHGVPVTEPLLVLGGSDQTRHSWTRHERWLGELGTVVTVDLPGFGDADFLPVEHGIDFLAESAGHMLRELGLGPVNLYAGCYGAAVGLRLAQRYPHLLRRIAVQGMSDHIPRWFAEALVGWVRLLEEGRVEETAEEFVRCFVPPPGDRTVRKHAALTRLMYRQFAAQGPREVAVTVERNRRLLAHEWYRRAAVPAVPYLVFTGEHDTLTTPDMVRSVAADLPGARFTTIAECGHLAHLQRPQDFCDLLVRFFRDGLPEDAGLPYCTPFERY